jgi:hypothetical protein
MSSEVSFPDQGDSIAGSCQVIIGVHSLGASTVKPTTLKDMPPTPSCHISLSIWGPFNRLDHSVTLV